MNYSPDILYIYIYYRDILIKAVLYQHRNRRIEQQSKIKDLRGVNLPSAPYYLIEMPKTY